MKIQENQCKSMNINDKFDFSSDSTKKYEKWWNLHIFYGDFESEAELQ